MDILKSQKDKTEGVVTIIDIGAGSGQLGYLIIKRLLEMKSMWPDPTHRPFKWMLDVFVNNRYIMTDCSPKLITWWKKNPFLQPFLKEGLLEVVVFDIEKDTQVGVSEGLIDRFHLSILFHILRLSF